MPQKITLHECVCLRCGYKWIPRIPFPRQCPNRDCHSIYWDVPRKDKSNGDKEGDNNG